MSVRLSPAPVLCLPVCVWTPSEQQARCVAFSLDFCARTESVADASTSAAVSRWPGVQGLCVPAKASPAPLPCSPEGGGGGRDAHPFPSLSGEDSTVHPFLRRRPADGVGHQTPHWDVGQPRAGQGLAGPRLCRLRSELRAGGSAPAVKAAGEQCRLAGAGPGLARSPSRPPDLANAPF